MPSQQQAVRETPEIPYAGQSSVYKDGRGSLTLPGGIDLPRMLRRIGVVCSAASVSTSAGSTEAA